MHEEKLWNIFKTMVAVLPKKQFAFLACWHRVCGEEDREFGFIGEMGLKKQSTAALKFLKKIDGEWNKLVLEHIEPLPESFTHFFYSRAVSEGIRLPENFIERVRNEIKIMEDL